MILTMSRSLAKVVATLSYGDTQLPDVAVHALLTTMLGGSSSTRLVETDAERDIPNGITL